jgi:hypothetical protein
VSVRHRRRLGQRPKKDLAAEEVLAMIADSTLKPGRPAPTGVMLAEQTGLSVWSCREALRRLVAEGTLTRGGRMGGRLRVAEPGAAGRSVPACATAAPVFPVSVTVTPDGVTVLWPDGTETLARPPGSSPGLRSPQSPPAV